MFEIDFIKKKKFGISHERFSLTKFCIYQSNKKEFLYTVINKNTFGQLLKKLNRENIEYEEENSDYLQDSFKNQCVAKLNLKATFIKYCI